MKIIIIGGGIAGLATAIALSKKGIEYEIYESSMKLHAAGAGLGLAANAMKAFEKLGIGDEVKAAGRVLSAFSIYDERGILITRTEVGNCNKNRDTGNFTIHRAALQEVLLRHVPAGMIHFGKKAIGVETNGSTTIVRFSDGTESSADLLIVADGIHSRIREQLWTAAKPVYAGYTCWRAVIENQGWDLVESSETWGGKGRVGIVPLADNQLYWFACNNAPQNSSPSRYFTVNDLSEHYKNFHEPIPDIIKATENSQLLWNDIIYLKPLRQYVKDNVVLVGDAAHATTPNMAQGACQALEDAVVLADELSLVLTAKAKLSAALKQYEQRRLRRTHMIVKQSTRIGKIAQIENEILIRLRNCLLRRMPPRINEKQQEVLSTVDF